MKLSDLLENPGMVASALMFMYRRQTADEQDSYGTVHQNGMGFNRIDAGFMTSVAQQYERTGQLSEAQIKAIRFHLQKYRSQLSEWDQSPLPIKEKVSPAQTDKAEGAKARLDGEYIFASFKYPRGDSRFGEMVNRMRTLSWRTWDLKTRAWKIRRSLENVKKIKEWGFEFDEKLQRWYDKIFDTTLPEIDVDLNEIKLFPFQRKGIAFIEAHDGRVLIGDEMGLGKTIQAIGWCALHPDKWPVIVVCPSAVKYNWRNEIKKCLPKATIEIVEGRTYRGPWKGNFIIVNYDILSYHQEKITEMPPSIVVFDECHFLKNIKAARTQSALEIGKRAKHIICLSGTPIVNRPVEFFTALKMLRPDLFASYWEYVDKYCGGRDPWGGVKGATNTIELHNNLVATVMLRRMKDEVLTELPPKMRSVVPIDIDNRKEYEKAESDLMQWMQEKGYDKGQIFSAMSNEQLTRFNYLKQIVARGKISGAIDWIRNYLESGKKLVVFALHHEIIDILVKEFMGSYVKLDGRDNARKKQDAVDQFQNDPTIRLFIANIKAGGIGVNLTAAPDTCFVELGWSPGEHDQAEDRVHRIGQKSGSVTAYYLIANDTIEYEIMNIIDIKRKNLGEILDGREVKEAEMLSILMDSMIKRLKGGTK